MITKDPVNQLLEEVGLSPEDLDRPGYSGEMETLRKEIDTLSNNPITIDKLTQYLSKTKSAIINELSNFENLSGNWLSALSFFIPIIGIIRKWYQDQKRMRLEVQLKVYTSIEDLLLAPQRKREVLQEKLMRIKNSEG